MTPYTYPCKILRVVDGDTLDIELDLGFEVKMKERVRLLGVDAPETYGRNATPEGALATDFVEKWVGDRAPRGRFMYQSLKYDARDKYGRSLGLLVWRSVLDADHEDLCAALVLAGHAVTVPK
jgi:micrococcal nuclease